jgi:hypothetical protein
MNPVRRFLFVARLLCVGLIAGSIIGMAPSASAAPAPAPVPSGTRLPDLTVAVSGSPASVAHGATHTYVLRVTNITWAPGPVLGASLSNVRVHLGGLGTDEHLLSFHDDSNAGFVCYTPAEYVGMDVRCVGGTVPTLSTVQITVTMQAPSSVGAFTSTATVDPYNAIAESNENNNIASVSFSTF